MLRPANVATPASFVNRVVVPDSVPSPGLAPILRVMSRPGITAPDGSLASTCTAGVMGAAAGVSEGWVMKLSVPIAVTKGGVVAVMSLLFIACWITTGVTCPKIVVKVGISTFARTVINAESPGAKLSVVSLADVPVRLGLVNEAKVVTFGV